MMRFHGWVELEDGLSLREAVGTAATTDYTTLISIEEYNRRKHAIAQQLQALIDEGHFDLRPEDVRLLTGIDELLSVAFHGQRNHYRSGPLDFLEWLRDHAPDSHGLLYIYNDERSSNEDDYLVYVLRDNAITRQDDPFLSPPFPAGL